MKIDRITGRDTVISRASVEYSDVLVSISDSAISGVNWPSGASAPISMEVNGAVSQQSSCALAFLILMTALNYKFWRLENGVFSRYTNYDKTGARALWRSFETAWGLEDQSPNTFALALERDGVSGVFGDIPDSDSRLLLLSEILNGDLNQVSERIGRNIELSGCLRVEDAALLESSFPLAYGDSYLKKAQLALAMYGGYLRSKGHSIESSDLTAFADYQVPRVLRAMGILVYSPEVAALVDGQQLIPAGSPVEKAIRAATVLACEKIALHTGLSASDVDNLLWQSQDFAANSKFHLTETTQY